MIHRFRAIWIAALAAGRRLGLRRDWYLVALGAGIGVITAYGAIGFKWLLDWTEHQGFAFQRDLPLWALPLIPMVGALCTGLLVHFFAPEARGHGVPEVMDALYRKKGRIRPRVAFVKSIASVCTIGSGGSAGAEGPIVQIGSAIGSGIAQWLNIPREQVATLLGCGAAAGIASVFNAPIAGVFFVLEILLRDFSLKTFTPIIVASVFSTATTQAVLGKNQAIFAVSADLGALQFTFPELPLYIVLGLVCGVVAVGFIRMLYFSEDLYERIRIHPIVKPITGALLLGTLGIVFLLLAPAGDASSRVPNFFGNGYATITSLLDPLSFLPHDAGELAAVASPHSPELVEAHAKLLEEHHAAGIFVSTTLFMLALLVAFKAIGTCLTLGSGGSGGVFAPSLFLGATTGALVGVALERIGLIPPGGSPAAYALVGMAAVVAGTTHAPLTAILILFELTRNVFVLLPIMLAAVIATLVAQLLMRDSIYSLKLRRRGVLVGTAADLTLLRRLTARDINPVPHVSVRPQEPLSKLLELRDAYRIVDFVVVSDEGRYLGLVTAQDLRTALIEREAIPYLLVEELLRSDLPTVHPEEGLDIVLEKFSKHDVASLAMIEPDPTGAGRVIGLITRERLMRRYQEALASS
ncbi:MAG: chloride channel protein [Phycisphaerales bacterium]